MFFVSCCQQCIFTAVDSVHTLAQNGNVGEQCVQLSRRQQEISSWTPGPHGIVLHLMRTQQTWSLCFVIHMERSMGHLHRRACRYSAILMPENPEVVDVGLLLWDYCLDRNAIRAVWVNNVTCTRPWQECLQFMPFPAGNGWKLELAIGAGPTEKERMGSFAQCVWP